MRRHLTHSSDADSEMDAIKQPGLPHTKALAIGTLLGVVPGPLLRRVGRLLGRGGVNEIDLLTGLAVELDLGGPMVDVGARFGTASAPFARMGWRVLQFEPDPRNHKVLRTLRFWRRRISIDSRAVSDQPQESATLFASEHSAISSLMSFDDSHQPGVSVEVVTLETALEGHGLESVAVLKIDAEGNDLRVLKGVDLAGRFRPDLIMCEFDEGKVPSGGHTYADLTATLSEAGYRLLVSEWFPIERYGAKHRWRAIEEFPYDLAAELGHGNVIAVDERHWGATIERRVTAWSTSMSD